MERYGLRVTVTPQTDISGVSIGSAAEVDSLPPGRTRTVEMPITADENVASWQIRLQVDVSEAHGFDLYPATVVTLGTRALAPPDLALADVGIRDQSGDGGSSWPRSSRSASGSRTGARPGASPRR